MKLEDFDYLLPQESIAQTPIEPRDHSKLLVLKKENGSVSHRHFYDVLNYLKPGDLLILNNSRVFPARLIGQKQSGGQAEIFLNHEIEPGLWEALGRRVKIGNEIFFPDKELRAVVVKKIDDIYQVRFNLFGNEFFSEIEKVGLTPLPPYIKREEKVEADRERYQTVFAKDLGSAAAPTAGLHFTPELLQKIRDKGIEIVEVTLHVGLGTFAPVKIDDIVKHKMHSEFYSVKKTVINDIFETKKRGGKIVAVGTTTTRVLESLFRENSAESLQKQDTDFSGWTDIFIYPGFKFRCVDALITNFHLPKSTLLMLVSAFAGKEKIAKAYDLAVANEYRFFSYGDAMIII